MVAGIEWGSLPDWLAAAGGLMSVGATGYIAILERKRANNLEDAQVDLDWVQRQSIIDEALRITNQITALYSALSTVSRGVFGEGGIDNSIQDDITRYCNSISKL